MWERTDKSSRPAREFAQLHGLDYSESASPEAARTLDGLPFTGAPLRHRVSGQWRGRSVQRFEAGHYDVELMTMRGPLPALQVIPSGLDLGALAIDGRATTTGDPAFDRRWSVTTANEEFAAALLTPAVREALMHPAAEGRAVTFRGDQVSTWALGDGSWDAARVRLDFLAVLAGRIDPAVWQQYGVTTPAPLTDGAAWVPGPEEPEGPQWAVAPMPQAASSEADDDTLSDTGEFEVALLNAELEGTTFIPEPVSKHDDFQASWLVAPIVR
ncbi:hypothetical protein [Demequina sp.]|uniref:hypothetical protein n=1 Tax=Demequina sp. TaxID=2050685 RepID=UPI0025BA22DE|nr:hypothetical protein [Demequina sp.]